MHLRNWNISSTSIVSIALNILISERLVSLYTVYVTDYYLIRDPPYDIFTVKDMIFFPCQELRCRLSDTVSCFVRSITRIVLAAYRTSVIQSVPTFAISGVGATVETFGANIVVSLGGIKKDCKTQTPFSHLRLCEST